MQPVVIFLHIEKAAGSSFRSLFYQNYGTQNVFWHGIEEEEEASEYLILGGHRTIGFYQKRLSSNAKPIYLAVLREPKERAISFYMHLRRYTDYFDKHKASDFNDAIINCKPFRDHIKGGQLSYITGQNKFSELESILDKNQYVIGTMENLQAFTNFISTNLDLEKKILPTDNIGLPNYQNTVDVNDETDMELDRLLVNDISLYKHIKKHSDGLFTNVPIKEWHAIRSTLEKLPEENKKFTGSCTFMKSQMPPDSIKHNAIANLNIFLKNKSNSVWSHNNGTINLSYHWLNTDDEMVIFEGIRTQVKKKYLRPNDTINQAIKVQAPNLKGRYKLKIVPMKTKYGWFEDEDFDCDTFTINVV